MKKSKLTAVRFSDDDWEALVAFAERERTSVSAVIRRAVIELIRREWKKK